MPLKVSDGASAWIDDFQKSDAPQFKGKTKEERREMAIAAYMDAKRGSKEEGAFTKKAVETGKVKTGASKSRIAALQKQDDNRPTLRKNEAKQTHMFDNEKDARAKAKEIGGKYVKGTGKSAGKHAAIKEGIVGNLVKKTVKKVGGAAVGAVKNRLTTTGRAKIAQKKIDKHNTKIDQKDTIAKAKAAGKSAFGFTQKQRAANAQKKLDKIAQKKKALDTINKAKNLKKGVTAGMTYESTLTEREDTAAAVARAMKKMGVKYDRKKENDIISKIPKVLDTMKLSPGAKRMLLRDKDFIADVLGDLNEAKQIEEKFTPKQIKMAIGIASDKRYAKGNMTGAVKAIEKIAKGLSNDKQVAAVLKRQNEDTMNWDNFRKNLAEAANAAQQAAIAIAKKEKGEKPKNEEMVDMVCKECGDEYGKPTNEKCMYDSKDPNGENWVEKGANEDVEYKVDGRRVSFKEKAKKLGYVKAPKDDDVEEGKKMDSAAMKKAMDAFKKRGGKITKVAPGKAAGYHGKDDPGADMHGMMDKGDTKGLPRKKKVGSMR